MKYSSSLILVRHDDELFDLIKTFFLMIIPRFIFGSRMSKTADFVVIKSQKN